MAKTANISKKRISTDTGDERITSARLFCKGTQDINVGDKIVWSDGATKQFKGAKNMVEWVSYQEQFVNGKVPRSNENSKETLHAKFFASNHGESVLKTQVMWAGQQRQREGEVWFCGKGENGKGAERTRRGLGLFCAKVCSPYACFLILIF